MSRPYANEGLGESWRRRAVSIPAVLGRGTLYLALLPLVLVAAAVRDLGFGGRAPTLRLALFGALYVVAEFAGIVAAAAIWLVSGTWAGGSHAAYVERNLALQRVWAGTLFAGVQRLYSVRVETEGEEALTPTPFLLFVRHASLVDTLLPAALVSARHGVNLRYVLKRELLADPCFDLVGLRTPNVFVRRGSGDAKREAGFIHRLAAECPPEQGVLIYPEGTRFTAERRERALDRIEASGDAARLARARGLGHVLPPRTAGPHALLEARPDLAVVVMAHYGLDGLAKLGDFLDGSLVDRRIRVHYRRIPAAEIPSEREERIRWLDAEWARVDAWVAGQVAAASSAPGDQGDPA